MNPINARIIRAQHEWAACFYSSIFRFAPYSLPTGLIMPYAGIFFLSFVLFLSVNSSYLPRVALSVKQLLPGIFYVFCPCNRYLFPFSTYGVPLAIAAFPFLSDLPASHSSEHLSFVLLCFDLLYFFFSFAFFVSLIFLFLFLLFSFFSLFSWSGLFC